MISVKCVRGAGDKEAPKITEELLDTEHIAVLRGKAFLDENYYDKTTRTIRVPYAEVTDGDIVAARDPRIASGNYHVKRVTISIDRPGKIVSELEIEGEYEES